MADQALTTRQEKAALELALGRRTDKEIAALLGISEDTLHRWGRRSEFADRVEDLRAAFARAVEGQGIADRRARVQKLQDMLDRMERIVAGRADDMPLVPGGSSGLLVRQFKQVGKDSYREEYPFDAALVREMRAVLQQAAQELGQWTERRQVDLKVSELDAAIERELARLAAGAEGAVALPAPGADGAETE